MKCVLSARTYQGKEPGDVEQVLAIPLLAEMLFPSKLPTGPGEELLIEKPSDFDFARVPEAFHPTNGFVVPLW
jgi:hypothetical protein